MPLKRGDTVHYHIPWRKPDVQYRVLAEGDHAVLLTKNPQNYGCQVSDGTPCVEDVSRYWETTEVMVLEDGYIAVALDEENQAACDHWRELYVDCWGERD
jgi:hypothetical protein